MHISLISFWMKFRYPILSLPGLSVVSIDNFEEIFHQDLLRRRHCPIQWDILRYVHNCVAFLASASLYCFFCSYGKCFTVLLPYTDMPDLTKLYVAHLLILPFLFKDKSF